MAASAPTETDSTSSPPEEQSHGWRIGSGTLRYVGGRLLGAVVSLIAVMVTGFFLFRIIPGDPVKTMTQGRTVTPAQLARLREQFGLDKSLAEQFLGYVSDLLHFDLGDSFQYHQPVISLIGSRIGPTVLLVGTATAIAALLGLWLGTRGAWFSGSLADRLNTSVALSLWSVPTFWLGLLLITVLGTGIGFIPGMFPTGGMHGTNVHGTLDQVLDVAHHLVLPVATLVAVVYAQYLMIMRSSLLDEKGADYLVTARAKGLRDAAVRRRHAVPNALLPTVTLIFVNLGQVVTGTILAETVFSWPGLGSLFYAGIRVPDLPLVQGLFLFFSAAVIVANLLADLIYPLLDPRVRAS